MSSKLNVKDVVIIGGGFYGCMIALCLGRKYRNVTLLEKENDLLTKASYNNQARVHNGYHYPRSFITAMRSHINFQRFVQDFKGAIDDNFLMTYAIAANNSKITGSQFTKLCSQVGTPLKVAPDSIKKLFDKNLIEEVFLVEEYVFNSHILRKILKERLRKEKVQVFLEKEVIKVKDNLNNQLKIELEDGSTFLSNFVINAAYASINKILDQSLLKTLPFKYEYTEMPLIQMPEGLKNLGVTIMDGPFFSIMPFPDKNLHTIHHVRYTPHVSWSEGDSIPKAFSKKSKFLFMIKDAQRYIPALKDVRYVDSLYETKTVLVQDEINDRRPILYKKDHGFKNFHIVMGGKIDNVYDIINQIEKQGL